MHPHKLFEINGLQRSWAELVGLGSKGRDSTSSNQFPLWDDYRLCFVRVTVQQASITEIPKISQVETVSGIETQAVNQLATPASQPIRVVCMTKRTELTMFMGFLVFDNILLWAKNRLPGLAET
jgi:hypothetical protein